MKPWWELYPEVYKAEINALEASGNSFTIDENARKEGFLSITVGFPFDGQTVTLRADYPGSYPYFPPEVTSPGYVFRRHQNYAGKNLCLLENEGEAWRPTQDTLASLLQDQFSQILAIEHPSTESAPAASLEEHAGHALSYFVHTEPASNLIVPDWMPPSELSWGHFNAYVRPIAKKRASPSQPKFDEFSINGAIATFMTEKNESIWTAPEGIRLLYRDLTAPNVNGIWVRLAERPPLDRIDDIETFIRQQIKIVAESAFTRMLRKLQPGNSFLIGIVYPDEKTYGNMGDDWLFARIDHRSRTPFSGYQKELIHVDWGGEDSVLQRAPHLHTIRNKSALIVGLGSLGSPLVKQLARSGIGSVHLVDSDSNQVGNSLRWEMGWAAAGIGKAAALNKLIRDNYPYTDSVYSSLRLGHNFRDDKGLLKTDSDFIERAISETDIVIDATAAMRVNHYLADLARHYNKPYVWLTTTYGTAGGIVGRIIPNSTEGCHHCFLHGIADGTYRQPAESRTEKIQPGGCAQPTFVGVGVNSDEIALMASRLAIATLCRGTSDGYPDFEHDLFIADLEYEHRSIAPNWTEYSIERHPECGHHVAST